MHQQSSVAHQSVIGTRSCPDLRLAIAGGQHWAAALRRLSCLSSLLGGAGESDQLARPGERASATPGLGWAGHYLLTRTFTLFRATAPRMGFGTAGFDTAQTPTQPTDRQK